MKLTINGENTDQTLKKLAQTIAQECHDVTLHLPTKQSIRRRADAIMHLAADMYVSAYFLAHAESIRADPLTEKQLASAPDWYREKYCQLS